MMEGGEGEPGAGDTDRPVLSCPRRARRVSGTGPRSLPQPGTRGRGGRTPREKITKRGEGDVRAPPTRPGPAPGHRGAKSCAPRGVCALRPRPQAVSRPGGVSPRPRHVPTKGGGRREPGGVWAGGARPGGGRRETLPLSRAWLPQPSPAGPGEARILCPAGGGSVRGSVRGSAAGPGMEREGHGRARPSCRG